MYYYYCTGMKSWKFPILEVPSVTSFQETKKLIG